MDVKGKVVVVTGGASGIGLGLCTRFAREGAQVVLSDLRFEAAAEQAAAIRGATPIAANVGIEQDVADLVQATLDMHGRIDMFCSNAGIVVDGGEEVAGEKWHQLLDVNLLAHVYAAKHVLPHMLQRGSGYLLNTASAAGLLTEFHSATTTRWCPISTRSRDRCASRWCRHIPLLKPTRWRCESTGSRVVGKPSSIVN